MHRVGTTKIPDRHLPPSFRVGGKGGHLYHEHIDHLSPSADGADNADADVASDTATNADIETDAELCAFVDAHLHLVTADTDIVLRGEETPPPSSRSQDASSSLSLSSSSPTLSAVASTAAANGWDALLLSLQADLVAAREVCMQTVIL